MKPAPPAASGEAVAAAPLRLSRRIAQAGTLALGLFVFILALELLKTGAGGVATLLRRVAAEGVVNAVGFGWLLAYVSMSGSPVAATALTLFGGGALTPLEAFGMINGSRFGASFIVLLTGFLFYLRGVRGRGVVAMGILSMATTATTYLPAMLLGAVALQRGWLAGIRFGEPRLLTSALDAVYDPITQAARSGLPDLLTFALGFGALLIAFQLFDRALPSMGSSVVETRWGRWFDRPLTTFFLGLIVTGITLSVSVSLSLLVPLASRGYVRRDQVIPYIMGANISTFVDTLFASLLLRTPVAFTIVLTEMLSVGAVSLVILLFFFRRYRDALMGLNTFFTANRWRFTLFVVILALVPLTLLLL
jgi:hypothetical protein